MTSLDARNKALARSLKAKARDESAYAVFRGRASAFRSGLVTAAELRGDFEQCFGAGDESLALFTEMAELLPEDGQRAALLGVAGTAPEAAGAASRGGSTAPGSSSSTWPTRAGGRPPGETGRRALGRLAAASSSLPPAAGPLTPGSGVIYWVRQDLRLHDNPALLEASRAASRAGGQVTIAFVHSPEEDGTDCYSDPGRRKKHAPCCPPSPLTVPRVLLRWLVAARRLLPALAAAGTRVDGSGSAPALWAGGRHRLLEGTLPRFPASAGRPGWGGESCVQPPARAGHEGRRTGP